MLGFAQLCCNPPTLVHISAEVCWHKCVVLEKETGALLTLGSHVVAGAVPGLGKGQGTISMQASSADHQPLRKTGCSDRAQDTTNDFHS